ncbi:MAG: transposase [Meiothermus sp.]
MGALRPKGSAKALEARRMLGGHLLQQGKGISEVARLLGLTPTSVFRWKETLEEGGLEALQAKPHPGRPPALSVEQKDALVALLQQGPLAAGFATDLWTLERVAQVIKEHFAVEYHPSQVWRILRALGWSPQKPDRRARERDEDVITAWRDETWPQIKKKPPTTAGASS